MEINKLKLKAKNNRVIKFKSKSSIGVGNTCFMNSVLQSVSYLKPMQELFLQKLHKPKCKRVSFCIVCTMEEHINRTFEASKPFTPKAFAFNLKKIAKHFRLGRQEDSHEFLRFLIDGMHEALKVKTKTEGVIKPTSATKIEGVPKPTSVIEDMFGGSFQSQVKCLTCKHCSNTYDPIMDICLDIKNCTSVEQSLQRFTAKELLQRPNQYRCEKCNKLVDAQKQTTIRTLPKVLTIQLKRFGYSGRNGSKVNRHVKFSEKMDLKPFVSIKEDSLYDLCGVLVHAGHSCGSGHYFTFVKCNGGWFRMDDDEIHAVNRNTVLSQCAYLLFYEKVSEGSSKPNEQKIEGLKQKIEEPVDLKETNEKSAGLNDLESSEAKSPKPIWPVYQSKLSLPDHRPLIPTSPIAQISFEKPIEPTKPAKVNSTLNWNQKPKTTTESKKTVNSTLEFKIKNLSKKSQQFLQDLDILSNGSETKSYPRIKGEPEQKVKADVPEKQKESVAKEQNPKKITDESERQSAAKELKSMKNTDGSEKQKRHAPDQKLKKNIDEILAPNKFEFTTNPSEKPYGLKFEQQSRQQSAIRAWNHMATSDVVFERNKIYAEMEEKNKKKRKSREDMLYDAPMKRQNVMLC